MEPTLRYSLTDFSAYREISQQLGARLVSHRSNFNSLLSLENARRLSEAVEDRLIAQYGGFTRKNGWLAALCPFSHEKDRPGMHFGFNPVHRCGYCFGRHGKISLVGMCQQLGISFSTRA
jgi:hypothetical protein